MRLDVSATGAVAYGLLVAGAAARIPPATTLEARGNRQVQFTEFSQYMYRYNSTMIQWTFDRNSGINITNVSLHRIDINGQLVGVVGEGAKEGPADNSSGVFTVGRGKPGDPIFEGTDEQGPGDMSVGTRDQDSEPLTFPYATEEAGGSATLPRSQVYFNRYKEDELINTALCLSVGWERDGPWRSFSHAFAITENTDFSAPAFKTLDETFRKASDIGLYEGTGTPRGSPSSGPSSSSEAAATSSADPNSAGDSPGRHSGLSVAAKAGIGVGAGIAGLILVGGLVFFLFCRRRRRRGPKPYGRGAGAAFASDSGVVVRDKEMAGVSQSGPHSLYASDPGRLHEHNDDAPAAAGGGARDSRHSGYGGHGSGGGDPRHSGYGGGGDDVESYRAEPAPGPSHGNDDGGRAAPAAADHASSRPTSEMRSPSRYAHLIEEGMTQDEIQRLEEEERQLDAAIENAGRGSRAA